MGADVGVVVALVWILLARDDHQHEQFEHDDPEDVHRPFHRVGRPQRDIR
jgi:hypothetical protein